MSAAKLRRVHCVTCTALFLIVSSTCCTRHAAVVIVAWHASIVHAGSSLALNAGLLLLLFGVQHHSSQIQHSLPKSNPLAPIVRYEPASLAHTQMDVAAHSADAVTHHTADSTPQNPKSSPHASKGLLPVHEDAQLAQYRTWHVRSSAVPHSDIDLISCSSAAVATQSKYKTHAATAVLELSPAECRNHAGCMQDPRRRRFLGLLRRLQPHYSGPVATGDLNRSAPVFSAFTNAAPVYIEQLLNWAFHVRALNLPHLVVCLDAESEEIAQSNDLPWVAVANQTTSEDVRNDHATFHAMVSRKVWHTQPL